MKIKNIIFGKKSVLTKDISKKLDNITAYSVNDLHLINFDQLNKQKNNYISENTDLFIYSVNHHEHSKNNEHLLNDHINSFKLIYKNKLDLLYKDLDNILNR